MAGASPLWAQVLFFALAPLIMASLIWALSRGWANVVQAGKVSQTTRKRQRFEFWGVLVFMYVMLACIFAYAHLRR